MSPSLPRCPSDDPILSPPLCPSLFTSPPRPVADPTSNRHTPHALHALTRYRFSSGRWIPPQKGAATTSPTPLRYVAVALLTTGARWRGLSTSRCGLRPVRLATHVMCYGLSMGSWKRRRDGGYVWCSGEGVSIGQEGVMLDASGGGCWTR